MKFKRLEKKEFEGCSVEIWNGWIGNYSQETRIDVVSTVASISYGNEFAKNPEKLVELLKKKGHNSCFEFIRGVEADDEENMYKIQNSLRHYKKNSPLVDLYKSLDCLNEDKENIFCFKIKAPIFSMRQITTHRSFSRLELSRRYTKDSKVNFEFYKLDENQEIDIFHRACYDEYLRRIESGYAPEDASRCMPVESMTETFLMIDKENFDNFVKQRCDKHAQRLTRELATIMLDFAEKQIAGGYDD